MAGNNPPIPPLPPSPPEPPADCGFDFEIDLVGVRADAAAQLSVSQPLAVRLEQSGGYNVVVCALVDTGQIVGSLANFVGLGALIACLQRGVQYQATVLSATSASCRAHVLNRPAPP